MQAPVREQLQQEADRATYERRALAVEQERAIGENELVNKIELAKREQELVDQEATNERLRVTGDAESMRITAAAEADLKERWGEAEAASIRTIGAAAGEAERAKMDAYAAIGEHTLLALALRDLAVIALEAGLRAYE